jgi:LAO/AO transport system kinase
MHDRAFVEKLLSGDRSALGRAITLIESTRPADQEAARSLLRDCYPRAGNSLRIGITGIPGVGKSTLIDALGLEMIRLGHKVAVLAIDPSSQRNSGSILGDKTRMDRLSNNPQAFIRPTATGGVLGGIARRTKETTIVCEAAGYDRILIETVGVGQSEYEVDHICDINVLLMIAGAGDELQGIKRGIMEAADLIAFTKADGDGAARAEASSRELKQALSLLPARPSGRKPEVLLTDSLTGKGIAALAEHIELLYVADRSNGHMQDRRKAQDLHWLDQLLHEGLIDHFDRDPRMKEKRSNLEQEISTGKKDPIEAAEELLRSFLRG